MKNHQRDALISEFRQMGKDYLARAGGHLPNQAGMLEKDKFNQIAAAYFYCAARLEEIKTQEEA